MNSFAQGPLVSSPIRRSRSHRTGRTRSAALLSAGRRDAPQDGECRRNFTQPRAPPAARFRGRPDGPPIAGDPLVRLDLADGRPESRPPPGVPAEIGGGAIRREIPPGFGNPRQPIRVGLRGGPVGRMNVGHGNATPWALKGTRPPTAATSPADRPQAIQEGRRFLLNCSRRGPQPAACGTRALRARRRPPTRPYRSRLST